MKLNNWLKVEDRVPNNDHIVLCFNEQWGKFIGWYGVGHDGCWHEYGEFDEIEIKPTHWMPLPEDPVVRRIIFKDVEEG